MLAFDASSILHGWQHYPMAQFPKLWDWIEQEIDTGQFMVPKVAFDEVGHISLDCHKWLKERAIQEIAITQEVLEYALAMKAALGVVNDRYNASGVDENDLLIIASAKAAGCDLISNEALQPELPLTKAKYKIPAVCSMAAINVKCLDFLEVLKRSGKSFG